MHLSVQAVTSQQAQGLCQWNGAGDVPCRVGAWDGLERRIAAL